MSIRKSLAVSSIVVFVAMIGLLLWGLMADADVHVPLLIDVSSTTSAEGDPEASLEFSPVGPVLAIGLLATILWTAGRLRGPKAD